MTIVDPTAIPKEIQRVHDELQESDAEFATVANNNVIILASEQTPQMRLQGIISAFTQVYPSRFFILKCSEQYVQNEISVSAMCHSLGGKHKVCSEIISIGLNAEHILALPSIVRANLLSGRLTELFVADEVALETFINVIGPSSDVGYIDSTHFSSGLHAVQTIWSKVPKVIDLSWLRLSVWRDAIKESFERPHLNQLLPQITKVSITAYKQQGGTPSTTALLLAGWFVGKLQGDVSTIKDHTVSCKRLINQTLSLTVDVLPETKVEGIAKVAITFATPSPTTLVVEQSDRGGLSVSYNGENPYHSKIKNSDDSEEALLSRHFLIGEAMQNFSSSLHAALALKIGNTRKP